MPATDTNLATAPPAGLSSRNDHIVRNAFYFRSDGQPIFAWLHLAVDSPRYDHGVIICPPIGYEQLHSHRSLRHLADALARRGIPTLRFDWHGTGDSAGIDEDQARLATWHANVRDAAAWMRHSLGCRQVSVVGLRIGATLAASAFEDLEINNLVLWAPVVKGRAYVREMAAIDRTGDFQPSKLRQQSTDIEAAGFTLSREAVAELSQLNLAQSPPGCRRALIVARDDMPADRRLFDWYDGLGVPVEQIEQPGVAEMLAEPHRTQVPHLAVGAIATWLETRIRAEALSVPPSEFGNAASSEAMMRHFTELNELSSSGTDIRERTIRICSQPDLFGILSEPIGPPSDNLPTIVLLNAGSAYRIGPGRLHVHIARQLAARGFRCLRMDVCGLGDSVTPEMAAENSPYPSTVFRDIEHTLRHLRQEFGMQRCVLMGLCSGAYAAFQSAVGLTDPALVESVLINPLTFFWKEGMSLDAAPVLELVKQHYYFSSALQPKKWLKLLTGRTSIGFSGAFKLLSQRLTFTNVARDVTEGTDLASRNDGEYLSHPLKDDLPADLLRVEAMGRNVAMFFATTDPGYSILTRKAGRATKKLCRSGRLRLSFVDDADHTFSRRFARQALTQSLLSYLLQRYAGDMARTAACESSIEKCCRAAIPGPRDRDIAFP